MDIVGKVAIVTGGASGIGAALARRFAADGASGIAVADINLADAQAVAAGIGERAIAMACDVSREADLQALVAGTRQRFGRIDAFCSNAGILGPRGGVEVDDAVWERMWQIHGMAHVRAARAVMPELLERGEGFFLVTASAAGLLNIVESAAYGVTKHASVAIAEWLRIAYGRRGVRVACLCPQAVDTAMTRGGSGSAGVDGMLSADQVAEAVTQTMRDERFLVLPHPEVEQYFQNKAANYDKWIGGMQKLYARHMGN